MVVSSFDKQLSHTQRPFLFLPNNDTSSTWYVSYRNFFREGTNKAYNFLQDILVLFCFMQVFESMQLQPQDACETDQKKK